MTNQQQLRHMSLSVWLIGLMFALPFIVSYHNAPLPAFYNEIIAFALGLFALFPLMKYQSLDTIVIPKTSLLWPILACIVIVQMQLNKLASDTFGWIVIGYFIWAFMLMQLGALHRKHAKMPYVIATISKAVISVAWLNLLYILLKIISKHPEAGLGGYGAIGQANHFCDFAAIAILALFYRHHSYASTNANSTGIKVNECLCLLSLLAFTILLVFSASKSAFIYIAVLITTSAYFYKRHSFEVNQVYKQLCLYSMLMIPLYFGSEWVVHQFMDNTFISGSQRVNDMVDSGRVGGVQMRLHFWQDAIQLWLQQPFIGHGVGQTRWVTFNSLDINANPLIKGVYENAHNILIHLLLETGVIGLLAVVIPLSFWIFSARKDPTIENWWILGVLSIFLIHSMLEYPFMYAYFLGLVSYLIGATERRFFKIRLGHVLGWLNTVFIGMTAFIGLLVIMHTWVAYNKINLAVTHLKKGKIETQALDEYYQALSSVNQKSLLAPFTYSMYAFAIESLDIEDESKLAVIDSSLRVTPNYKSAYMRAYLLLKQERQDEALLAMKKAIQAYPGDYQKNILIDPEWSEEYEALHQQGKRALSAN